MPPQTAAFICTQWHDNTNAPFLCGNLDTEGWDPAYYQEPWRRADRGDARTVETRGPVFVLENKVKSLPYADQLVQYTNKANIEWNKKSMKNSGRQTCNAQSNISFILLSLTDAENLKNNEKLSTWSLKTYNDLVAGLNKHLNILTDYHQQVCQDYYNFIMELSTLAKS